LEAKKHANLDGADAVELSQGYPTINQQRIREKGKHGE